MIVGGLEIDGPNRRYCPGWMGIPRVKSVAGFVGSVVLAGLAGCAVPASSKAAIATEPIPPNEPVGRDAGPVGYSVEGRPIEHHVLGFGAETILIMASIHGNEPAGTPLVERLRAEIADDPSLLDGRRVVLVPVVNPDGLAARRRGNARGIDLNRDYPAANRRDKNAPVQPETAAMVALIDRYGPDRIVTLHQPIACVDYDGPAESLARSMAAAADLPVRKLGARPGSLGSYAGVDRAIGVVTVELPGAASRWSDEELWRRYGPMMLESLGTTWRAQDSGGARRAAP